MYGERRKEMQNKIRKGLVLGLTASMLMGSMFGGAELRKVDAGGLEIEENGIDIEDLEDEEFSKNIDSEIEESKADSVNKKSENIEPDEQMIEDELSEVLLEDDPDTLDADVSDDLIHIGNCSISLLQNTFEYDGNEKCPEVMILKNGDDIYHSILLVEGVDYTVSYSDNINPGTATARIEGIGNYKGVWIEYFEITDNEGLYKQEAESDDGDVDDDAVEETDDNESSDNKFDDNVSAIQINSFGVLYENYDGVPLSEYTNNQADKEVFIYNPVKYMDLTVTYKDGREEVFHNYRDSEGDDIDYFLGDGTGSFVEDTFELRGAEFEEDIDIDLKLILTTGQKKDSEWGKGRHIVKASLGSATTEFIVEVVECPVQSITPKENVVNVIRAKRDSDGKIIKWFLETVGCANPFETHVIIRLKKGTVLDTEELESSGSVGEVEGDVVRSIKCIKDWHGYDLYTHLHSDYSIIYSYPAALEGSTEDVTATISFLGFKTNYKIHFCDEDDGDSEGSTNDGDSEDSDGEEIHVTGVSLNKTSLSLFVGGSATLAARISPSDATNQDVTWESDDEDVATVSEKGVVKAIGAGTTSVWVTTDDGDEMAECIVTVKKKTVKVTKVALNKKTASLVKGKTLALKATVSPSNATNKSVTWKSSNTKIATVSSKGVVKGVKAGTATITVTTKDGNKTATCKVTVKPVAVKSVKLNKKTASIKKGKTITLKATVSPSNATTKTVTWKTSNKKIATVTSSGKVKGIKKGTATITVTTKDGKKTAKCKVTVK